ncbi:CAMK family protein kinase [Histomonas meleagridis]|uniref:CAMK family protein kinase n=1 Tax=Histomonas meleagridis TaxID=135588 RepID=UPI00355A66E0|nr:CAMK family protein kinase [Histomonas meleagridis]KAH0798426.1 CAMK family protein kinase [Histomonas meleagridis]
MNERIQEIGEYRLGRTLGSGTTGKVKLAVHKDTNAQYAIKIIKKSMFAVKPDLERKIHREIALMRLLEHPHLLKLYEVFESPHHLYIVIEYASNSELFDYLIQQKFLPQEEAMMFFREIIYGLDFLHSHGICHRDLKPENILLDENMHIKIADFGFARWMRSNIAETSCGSPHYAAPEVIYGLPYDGRCADIWSCGVILYALLSGRLPFDDESIRSLMNKIKSGQYKMPPFQPEVQDLISRMLCVDVKSRITISQIKSHPAFLMGLPKGYQVPTPLPNPTVSTPIELTPNDLPFMHLLRSIGYNSDDEIIEELTSNEYTSAKMFYQMYNHNTLLDSLPWYDESDGTMIVGPSEIEQALMMPPRQFAAIGNIYDPFAKKKVLVESIGSVHTPQSFVQRPDWDTTALPKMSTDIEQMLIGIQLPLEELMLFLQKQLTSCRIKWFHFSDTEMVAKRLETDMLLTLTASYESPEVLTLCVLLLHGQKEEFEVLIKMLERGLNEVLNEAMI